MHSLRQGQHLWSNLLQNQNPVWHESLGVTPRGQPSKLWIAAGCKSAPWWLVSPRDQPPCLHQSRKSASHEANKAHVMEPQICWESGCDEASDMLRLLTRSESKKDSHHWNHFEWQYCHWPRVWTSRRNTTPAYLLSIYVWRAVLCSNINNNFLSFSPNIQRAVGGKK